MFIRPVLRRARKHLSFIFTRFRFWFDIHFSGVDSCRFACNICGTACRVPLSVMSRERASCYGCGSTVRYRSVVNALLTGLEITPVPLPHLSKRNDVVGIGMTDSDVYSRRLQRKFAYKNTYYHKEPRLDILNAESNGDGVADFIICSDVLEHVCPPVGRALHNLFGLLKRGGVLVLTLPIVDEASAIEHFPNLNDYHIEVRGGRRVLINRTVEGVHEEFDELIFHGGEGETLEMRLFSKKWLLEELASAGFEKIKVMDDECAEFGILWRESHSVPILAWK